MERYLFLSDIDGTLLRGNSGIDLGVKQAAKKFMDKGGLLALCTGRSPISTAWVARELDIQIPCVLYNGAAIYDFINNKFISSFPLQDDVLKIVQRVYEFYPGISIQVYTNDNIYLIRKNEHLETRGVKEEIEDTISYISDVQGEILKITMSSKDIALLKRCGEEVFNTEQLRFAFASTHFAEVVAREAGKGVALYMMAERYGVDIKHTFAAGDGMTDLPMLKACGFSFAPLGAAQPLLEVCDMKIPSCEKGGMEEAFNAAIEMMR